MNNPAAKEKNSFKKRKGFFPLISSFWIGKEKDYFIENLSMLLTSGMDVFSSIEAVEAEIRSKRMRQIVADLKEEVESGSSLWRALQNTGIIPSHIVFLVQLGEETGRLAENLKVVVNQQQKDRDLRSRIRSAMVYPVIVLSLTVLVGFSVAWFVLPRLAVVFSQLKIELPLITKIMISTGIFLSANGKFVVPAAVILMIVVIYAVFFNPKTKFIGQSILSVLPGTGRLIQEVELARFGFILGTLLEAGLLVTSALDSLQKATTTRSYQKLYAHLSNMMEEGNSFQKGFALYPRSSRLVPTPIQQMVAAGEQSGHLPQTLFKIGENFERKTEATTKNLSVILEPVLLFIVWLGVIAVALSVILPIYSLIGGLNK